jgi:ABC-type Mn2+/Zn2+ transport system permease subunit
VDWFVEPFEFAFMQRALLAGLLTVVATSLIGTWVVLRGITFIGDALAHGVIPGIALAFLWGFDITIGALASAFVMVLGVNLVSRRTRLPEDTGIGLLFVGMLALGVVIISKSASYAGDLTSFLFGNVLGVKPSDLWLQLATVVVVVAGCLVFYRPFLVLSFDARKAEMLGLRPRLAHAVMLGLVALSIVASFRTVGTLLVFGLLIGPPATASLLVRRVPAMMVTGVAIGLVSVYAGLLLSYHYDTAAGATMSGLSVAVFFVVLAAKELATVLGRRRTTIPAAPA